MDISALLSPTTTPTPGSGSPTNSSPVPGPSTGTPSAAASHHHNHLPPSITRRDSQPSLAPSSYAPQPQPPLQPQSYPHPASAYQHQQQQHHHQHQHHHQIQQQQQQQQHSYHHHIPAPQSHPASGVAPQYAPHSDLPQQQQQQQQYQYHQQQQQSHQPSTIPLHRPSLNDTRSHSSSALLHSRKPPSQQSYFSSHPDVRRESLPVVPEKPVAPPAPVRHHSLNFIDNPTFAPSPLATTQISTPAPLAVAPPPPLPQTTQGRIPSFSSDRGPISRTGSTASMVTMDEERVRTEQGTPSRRVSRTKSSASVEMMVHEPTPSPKDANPELFFDDEDEDVDMDEEAEVIKPLGEAEYERMADLLAVLGNAHLKEEGDPEDAPPPYSDCVDCIELLRRGFVVSKFDKNYDFKERLNEERENMLSIYPLTEEMWVEWLHDESIHADDILAKVKVMELWAKSIAHEAGSVTLWKGYIKFVLRTWREAGQRAEAEGGDSEGWAEVFSFELVNSVLQKAIGDTMWNIPRSHEIWNKYCELQLVQLKVMPPGSNVKIEKIQRLYLDRLQVPHEDIDSTFSAYSSFVSTYLPQTEYEATMKLGNEVYQKAKKSLEDRQRYEYRLRNSYGQDEEGQVWQEYLDWECKQRNADPNLGKALYQRCVLRYPTNSAAWEEYVCFMLDKKPTDPDVLPLLELATAHCQWSGTLWSHRILAFDVRQQPFESIERIKHQATTSRLLVDQEESFKVHLAWCGVLKRRGAGKSAVDSDSFDIADMGLRSALSEIGPIDKDYRIARLLIAFLTETGNVTEAEKEWRVLEKNHQSEYEFWLRYYGWTFRNLGNAGATAVLKKAVSNWHSLDWPEKIIDIYNNQIEEHGQGADIEGAMMHIRRLRKQVARRRQKEAEAQEAEYAAQAPVPVPAPVAEGDHKGKRRRSTNVDDDDALPHKKARASEDIEMESIPPVSEEAEKDGEAAAEKDKNTRDREKLTVFAKNLPHDVDELAVRKFFKDCGTINAVNMVETDSDSATASIEFQNAADVLAALTRDKKKLNGREITVQGGYNTTVYVTNFPPTADEKWIRELFKECGPIVEVRFPSLKYNTHRRFCYVQFDASEDAEKATEMNGKEVEGFKLVAKLSDPSKNQERKGAVHEGREVFVRNIDYDATEADVRELFSKYGTIESIRLICKGKGTHSGYGFIDFETAEAAQASLELHEHKMKNRKLMVVIGEPQGGAPASKKTSGKSQAKFPNGAAGSPEAAGSPMSTTASEVLDAPGRETIRQKTLYVLNIADTVNDSKIRAVFEKFGPLHKVQLKLNHQAAVVEFVEVSDAGRASLALDGHEIDGRAISFGTRQDMLNTGAEKKPKPGLNPYAKKKDEKAAATVTSLAPARVHRPVPAVRGGKARIGLGFRSTAKKEESEEAKEGEAKPKTNAEFRQMLLKGKADAEDRE